MCHHEERNAGDPRKPSYLLSRGAQRRGDPRTLSPLSSRGA